MAPCLPAGGGASGGIAGKLFEADGKHAANTRIGKTQGLKLGAAA